MFWTPPSPRAGLSVALGLLAAAIAGPAFATGEIGFGASARQRFELISADRATELPPELRPRGDSLSIAEALGLEEASAGHTVHLRWIVREKLGLSGYRLTLIAPDGLPGHLGARWWVAPSQGIPVGDGLTAYSAEIALAFNGGVALTATIEAVDAGGHAVLLATRRSMAGADAKLPPSLSARPFAASAAATALLFSRMAPSARSAALAPTLYPLPSVGLAAAPLAVFSWRLEQGGSVSGRGPPPLGVTT